MMIVIHLFNYSPTKALDSKTPYEACHRYKPVISHHRIFGCQTFVKEFNHIDKLDA